MRRHAKLAGIPEVSQHSFRRRYAVKLLEDDMQQEAIKNLMGHSSSRVLESYARFTAQNNATVYTRHMTALDPEKEE